MLECESCEYRTMALGVAREHNLETGHSTFRVDAPFHESYIIKIMSPNRSLK